MKRSQAELEAIVAKQDAEKQFRAEAKVITSDYVPEEINTFRVQEEEARAYAADPTAQTLFLDAMVAETGESKADVVANIIAKADALKIAAGAALGRKRKK